jgi:hypothetical protein
MLAFGVYQERQATMMADTFFRRRNLALMAAMALPLAGVTGFALSIHAGANTHLQEIADDAALAGVNSLAANIDRPADVSSAEAITAARTVIASQPALIQRIQPSVDGLTMSVVVEDAGNRMQASATARYVPAKDGRSVPWVVHMRGYTAAAL